MAPDSGAIIIMTEKMLCVFDNSLLTIVDTDILYGMIVEIFHCANCSYQILFNETFGIVREQLVYDKVYYYKIHPQPKEQIIYINNEVIKIKKEMSFKDLVLRHKKQILFY